MISAVVASASRARFSWRRLAIITRSTVLRPPTGGGGGPASSCARVIERGGGGGGGTTMSRATVARSTGAILLTTTPEVAHRVGGREAVEEAGPRRAGHHRRLRRRGHARGRHAELDRHRDAQRGPRVVGDARLRVPVRAVAEQPVALARHHRHLVGPLRRTVLPDRLGIDRLPLDAALVLHGQGQLVVARQRRGQVHDHAVLVAHAQEQQPAQLLAGDRRDGVGVGQGQGQRAEHERLDPQPDHRPPGQPLAVGGDVDVDVVVEDVVLGQVVLVVELATARQLLRRGVDGDVALALAAEEGDVLGLALRPGVGQRAEAPGAHLGDHVARLRQDRPDVAAHVAQVEAERLGHFLVEDLRRPGEEPGVGRGGAEHAVARGTARSRTG